MSIGILAMRCWAAASIIAAFACQPASIPDQRVLTPDLVLGGPQAEWQFITSVSADEDGRVFVTDQAGSTVFVYAPTGELLRTIGRSGGGPGEFEELYGWIPFGSGYAALDAGNARIQLFDQDFRPTTSLPWRSTTGPGATVRFLVASRSEVYVPTMDRKVGKWIYALARVDSGKISDVFPGYEVEPGGHMSCVVEGKGRWVLPIPFSTQQIGVPAPGGLQALASTERYAVHFASATGDTITTVSGDWPADPVTEADWLRENSLYREFRGYWKSAARCQPTDMPRPRSWPAITGIYFDPSGQLYIETRRPAGSQWNVFNLRGRPLRRFSTPERDPGVAPWFTGEAVYLAVRDSDDVQWVHRYTLNQRAVSD